MTEHLRPAAASVHLGAAGLHARGSTGPGDAADADRRASRRRRSAAGGLRVRPALPSTAIDRAARASAPALAPDGRGPGHMRCAANRRRRRSAGRVVRAALEGRGTARHFPITGPAVERVRPGAGGGRRVLRGARGRDARPGRRVRLRQVHDRAAGHAAAGADVRHRSTSTAGHQPGYSRAAAARPAGATCRWSSRTRTRRSNPRHTVGTILAAPFADPGRPCRARRPRRGAAS